MHVVQNDVNDIVFLDLLPSWVTITKKGVIFWIFAVYLDSPNNYKSVAFLNLNGAMVMKLDKKEEEERETVVIRYLMCILHLIWIFYLSHSRAVGLLTIVLDAHSEIY